MFLFVDIELALIESVIRRVDLFLYEACAFAKSTSCDFCAACGLPYFQTKTSDDSDD